MDEGHEMYEMHFPAPDVGPKNGGLTMVVALQGYADAGLAVAGSASHLIDALHTLHQERLHGHMERMRRRRLIFGRREECVLTFRDDERRKEDMFRLPLKKLKELPGETQVICGHGSMTTIEREIRDNPYL